MMTRKIVSALQMPLIPGLFSAEPTWMAARVRPALGKTNCERNLVSRSSERDVEMWL